MTNPATQDIKELERLHATLGGFLSQSSWTPAMGAQLVSGILPSGRSIKVPEDGAASLGNPAIPVGARELRDARNVLENWLDWDLDRREGDEDSEPASSVAPMDFLLWCTEEYESQQEWKKPGWLDYLSSFVSVRGPTDAPLPALPQLVARAAELEHVASFVRVEAGNPPSVTSQGSVKADPDNYLVRMTAVMLNAEDARSPIASLIVQALAASDNPKSPASVWAQLYQMAKSGRHPTLRLNVKRDLIEIPHETSGWKTYTRGALQQYLARYRRAAGLMPGTESTSGTGDDGEDA
jgi:hypothetical protein